jgi:hypothetical protein
MVVARWLGRLAGWVGAGWRWPRREYLEDVAAWDLGRLPLDLDH